MPLPDSDVSYITSSFMLEVEGKVAGLVFKEASGFGMSTTVVEKKAAGGGRRPLQKGPGATEAPNDITLKRAVDDNMSLWDWIRSTSEGETKFPNGSLTLYNIANKEIGRYDLERVWPSKVSLGEVSAEGTDAVTEEVTLTVYRVNRVK